MPIRKLFALALLILIPTIALAAHSVVIAITDATNPAGTTYNIYRGAGVCSSNPSLVKVGSTSTKAFTDPNLAPGTYCYAATAVNSAGDESGNSPTAGAVIPAQPNTVTITVTVQ